MNLNPNLVKAFAESMPKAYTRHFDWPAITDHCRVALRRLPGHTAIGACSAPRLPGFALCIIADDRPGLLASISAAFVNARLDVIAAEAYTRRLPEKQREAVDLFWVQRLDRNNARLPLSESELAQLESTLDALVLEQYAPTNVRFPTRPPPPPGIATETNVRFLENRAGLLDTLEVETDDRTGMLLVLARTLYEQQVQIVSSEVRTDGGRVRDRFEVTEIDDSAIKPERRLALQVAILRAVQETFGQ